MLKESVEQTVTNDQLARLYEQMIENGDETSALKVLELYKKQLEEEFVISFAGHFSAGKSSLLNYVLGKDVLPKSPIPTSANIVKITSGEGVARIYFNNETTVQYNEPYDIDMIKDYCMDRDTIKQIEINTSEQILPKHTYLVDTPGIDAADDADRLMTESSLHIIDVLFYVMDYNHVQSEVNLYFLQEMQKQNIPFYIVINQIDKHNEEEIPFLMFDQRVKQTFEQWQIKPENIYYTSVIDDSVQHNELLQLKDFIYRLLNKNELVHNRMNFATEQIVKQHKQFLRDQYESELVESNEQRSSDSLHSLENELTKLTHFEENLHDQFNEEVNMTLDNAYLMPAQLREMARSFLESQQRDFKVGGFLFAKKKTEQEKETRMNTFLTELQKTIESTIQWRLRDKLSELLRNNDIHEENLFQSIQNIIITYTNDDILRLVNRGATVNGNYILNYTNEVSADIKRRFRSLTNDLWDEIKETICNKNKDKIESLQHEIAIVKESLQIDQKNEQLKSEFESLKRDLDKTLTTNLVSERAIQLIEKALEKSKKVVIEDVPLVQKEDDSKVVMKEENETKQVAIEKTPSIENTIHSIDQIVKTVSNLNGFQSIVTDLKDKRDRLNDRELTIALFGAFSAGKSSFSNALFGEKVLPVSPNPTTAVINRISPVTDKYKHGTVIITLKDNDMLTSDLNNMLKDLDVQSDDFHQLIDRIKSNKLHEHEELNKMYQAYLQALIEGYDLQKEHIGKEVTISLDEFEAYVTDESKACYVESVDLYYDCDVTRQGITIVDTPGADSINARHTNVAFDYIKYADAILYVTYYNHAITRADRDFLMQLGRVKESFELDKMFFIVNAADLAKDETELELVLDYVKDQLLQFGIRFPNVFPVSSKQSLEEKVNETKLNEKMAHFEQTFYSFIHKELTKLTIQSAVWDMNRAHKLLLNYLNTVNLGKQEKEKFKQELKNKEEYVQKVVANVNVERVIKQVSERIKRQLHYVNERLYIRFHDMFADHYNPTTVTESGQRGMAQIRKNRNELIDYVGYELLQEVRAVSLRVESYINTVLSELHEQIGVEIAEVDESFTLANFTNEDLTTPEYEQAFLNIDKAIFTPAMKLFRGTKAFFEQNEREKMKEAFYNILKDYVKLYLDENEQLMVDSYRKQTEQLMTEINKKIISHIKTIIDDQLTLMTDDINIDELNEKEKVVQSVIKQLNG